MIVRVAKLTQCNYEARAKSTGIPQLLTIELSHYVEMARWSLDASGGSLHHFSNRLFVTYVRDSVI